MSRAHHRNVLRPALLDEIALCQAVQERFLNLTQTYLRLKGAMLFPPPELDSAMLLWRTMTVRHKKGDFRSTDEEVQAVKEIAQWTVDENCLMRNQPPQKVKFQ